uniref:Uncharacterized protein n=1 Tax=Lepeophtheirus salmonis TaxID=72036 RepID=A0A0K2TMF5_LEPSM
MGQFPMTISLPDEKAKKIQNLAAKFRLTLRLWEFSYKSRRCVWYLRPQVF